MRSDGWSLNPSPSPCLRPENLLQFWASVGRSGLGRFGKVWEAGRAEWTCLTRAGHRDLQPPPSPSQPGLFLTSLPSPCLKDRWAGPKGSEAG